MDFSKPTVTGQVVTNIYLVKAMVRYNVKSLSEVSSAIVEYLETAEIPQTVLYIAIDCANRLAVDPQGLKEVASWFLKFKVKHDKSSVVFLNADKNTDSLIKREGLEKHFSTFKKTFKPAIKAAAAAAREGSTPANSKLESAATNASFDWFRPIIKSIVNLFAVQCGTKTVIGEISKMPLSEIAGSFIGSNTSLFLDGKTINVSLYFPVETFKAIIGKMNDTANPTLTEELASYSSELLNIALGQAKQGLLELGHEASFEIPKSTLPWTPPSGQDPCVKLPITIDQGEFFLLIVCSVQGVQTEERKVA